MTTLTAPRGAQAPAPAAARPAVELRLNPRRLWRWHFWLAEALARRHPGTVVRFVEGGAPLPRRLALLLSLERLVFRLRGEHACDPLAPEAFAGVVPAADEAAPPILLDLSGATHAADGRRILQPPAGAPDEDGLILALLAGAPPRLALADSAAPGRAWTARPAVTDPHVLTRALDQVFSRQLDLCLKAVSGAQPGAPIKAPAEPRPRGPLAFAGAMLADRLQGRLETLCRRGPRWFVGWRRTQGDRVRDTGALPRAGYRVLPDDGRRYYADPFLIEADGGLHLFCEEFDYALGRGIISATRFGPDGTPGMPRPVLERPDHLSYPFVFAHAGQIWMIPESTAARCIELYRADPFPDRWVREATLLSGIAAADATLVREGGLWWLFAATAERQSSDWDALSLFHAPDLFGPWTPHPANPVLIDATAARPAGHIHRRDGRLVRPAQDCSTGYGAALALCAIDRLDPEGYAQTTQTVLRPGPAWPGRGLHTLNEAGGIETVDGFGSPAEQRRADTGGAGSR